LSEATRKGDVNIEIGWGMYNTHEGILLSNVLVALMMLDMVKERISSLLD
jgi:hypothetical protein